MPDRRVGLSALARSALETLFSTSCRPKRSEYVGLLLLHYPVLDDLVGRVRLARQALAPCRSILTLRARDPVEMCFSFFKWDARALRSSAAISPNEWIPNNLQANLLVDSRRADRAQTRRHAFDRRMSRDDWAVAARWVGECRYLRVQG